jgi:hypothetical protein
MLTKSPSQDRVLKLVEMRLLVGFLGQRKNGNWWNCDFLDPIGIRFLEATFPRTARKAALRSTCEAALRVHDQALGRIGTYHLFRLPAQLELVLEGGIESIEWDSMGAALAASM